MGDLKDVQWEIVSGAKNMAQAVEYKLTENEARNNKQEQVLTSTYADVQKIPPRNRGEPRRKTTRASCIGPEIDGFGRNIRNEVLASATTLVQNHPVQGPKTQEESTVRESHPECHIWGN